MHACSQQVPLSLKQVAGVLQQDLFKVGHAMKKVAIRLKIHQRELPMEEYIEKDCEILEYEEDVCKLAKKIYEEAKESGITSGRNPYPISATCVYMAAKVLKKQVKREELADTLGVSDNTVKRRNREVVNKFHEKIRKLPWGKQVRRKDTLLHVETMVEHCSILRKKFKAATAEKEESIENERRRISVHMRISEQDSQQVLLASHKEINQQFVSVHEPEEVKFVPPSFLVSQKERECRKRKLQELKLKIRDSEEGPLLGQVVGQKNRKIYCTQIEQVLKDAQNLDPESRKRVEKFLEEGFVQAAQEHIFSLKITHNLNDETPNEDDEIEEEVFVRSREEMERRKEMIGKRVEMFERNKKPRKANTK